ncbi:MAG: alcohol dehydrogenase catalytic domain-containing protein [Candidatus Thermoplasmatota archaeon]|nr:alcohol dehydrogenase catalytic domain-containing protein [Candidatus Thermoplasmatota archaeon]
MEDVEDPVPERGEVLVRVEACGACHSDLHAMREHFVPLEEGHILGHEISGRVEGFGPDCRNPYGLSEGDPVIVSWIASCGVCDDCSRGDENLCRYLEMPGLTPGRQGGLAEFVAVPEHVVIPLPADLPLEEASVLSCAYGTSYNALRNRGRLRPGESIAVFGCGGVGLAAIQLATLFGASTIVGIDILERKLQWARELGATHVVDASKDDPVGLILEATDQRGVDLAIEAIPGPKLESSMEVVRRGGRLVVVGLHPMGSRVPLDMMGFSMYNLSLIACLGYSPRRDLPQLVSLVAAGRLDPGKLISRYYTWQAVNEAYRDLERGRVARAVIRIR